jgi:hypothetical protein
VTEDDIPESLGLPLYSPTEDILLHAKELDSVLNFVLCFEQEWEVLTLKTTEASSVPVLE